MKLYKISLNYGRPIGERGHSLKRNVRDQQHIPGFFLPKYGGELSDG